MKKIFVICAVLATVVSCSKNNGIDDEYNPDNAAEALRRKVIDTTASYSKLVYLWTDQLPNQYSYNLQTPADFMSWIRNYSKDPGSSTNADRWSFAVKKEVWDDVSTGIAGDFGMNAFFYTSNDLRVSTVEKNGPAGLKGVQRGWKFVEVNGSSNITTGNAEALANAIYGSASGTFKFEDLEGNIHTISLTVASYQQDPFALDTTYEAAGKKIAYMVFNSFLGDTTYMLNRFATLFNEWNTEGVSEFILDLRYNGGGYTKIEHALSNYLIPAGKDGQVLSKDQFNSYMSEYDTTVLVKKRGNLELDNLYVIIGPNTASASEALINSLRAHMNVVLIGNDYSHGKPVGYFPIGVGDWYIFPVSFRTVNANGQGHYYEGLAPQHVVDDGLNKAWGDLDETQLAKAISLISGQPGRIAPVSLESLRRLNELNKPLRRIQPFGMVGNTNENIFKDVKYISQ